ncbi:LysR family transcriptional regulator [Arthrobacter sp. ISL-30]|uniref:LysR family transcriptional regulator n=1 Tax=Arthrobacter sp. ISL-30 TaxID=2819109 RepID=UPI001BEAC7DD|nr:LysR family transcriptional regulator [Arthrobacter sp. ISL-30]MBT2513540.1 LysR family transcriptional regulator [Arthrobacter sp. ISL-30]
MVNLLHLRTLLEVTRLGSFAAAAARLGYTASAVSQQMSALERDTGVELFHRSARSVVPTEAALTMTRHASKVLTDVEALMASASRTHDSAAQELRLGIFPSLATYVLPAILGNPRWKDLGIDLRVSVAEPAQTIQGLRTGGELDLALVYQVGQSGLAWPHSLERQWIGDDNFRVVLPSVWGIREDAEVAAAHLSDMPWIIHHPGTSDAMVIERLFASCNLHPRVVAYSDDFHASLEMTAAGLGASLVPELALVHRPAGVVVLDVPDIRLARNVFALLINEKRTAQVQLFTELLADTLHSTNGNARPTPQSAIRRAQTGRRK